MIRYLVRPSVTNQEQRWVLMGVARQCRSPSDWLPNQNENKILISHIQGQSNLILQRPWSPVLKSLRFQRVDGSLDDLNAICLLGMYKYLYLPQHVPNDHGFVTSSHTISSVEIRCIRFFPLPVQTCHTKRMKLLKIRYSVVTGICCFCELVRNKVK